MPTYFRYCCILYYTCWLCY